MKTVKLALVVLLLFVEITAFSQVSVIPQGFNYQAIARDTLGSPKANQNVTMKFTITNQTGTSIPYIETQTKMTDQFGLFTCVIGQGTQIGGSGTFSQVDWKVCNYYLKVEIQQGMSYYVIGTEPLLTVPYAMVAKEAIYAVPPGTIVPFAGDQLPTGWLYCDGSELLQTDYPELFDAIHTYWGSSDPLLKFRVPDMRGLFLRGMNFMDNSVGTGGGNAFRDPNESVRTELYPNGNSQGNVGSYQDDAFQGHKHNSGQWTLGGNSGSSTYVWSGTVGTDPTGLPISDGSNGIPKTTSETRPKNVYVNFIIKY